MSLIQKILKPAYSHEELLASVPVNKAIPLMSIPAVIGVLMILVTTLTNTLYVGLIGSNDALVAVGVIYPVSLLFTTIAMILGAGLAATVGRHLGADRLEDCNQTASVMFAVCLVVGLVCTCVGLIFYKPLFGLLGASERVLEYAEAYFIVAFISNFIGILAQFMNYIASAESNMKLGMVAFITNSVIHIALMPVLIFVLNMGLLGAAVTSLIAQVASFILMLLPYVRKKMLLSLSVKNIVWKRGMIPHVLMSGIPLGITQILMAFSIAFTNIMGKQLLKDASESFIAGYGIAVKIMVMVQYLIITYMIGYQAIAAYSYGAKNKTRFWEAYHHTRKVVLFAGISVAVLFSLLSGPLVRLFTDDPQIIQYAVYMMLSMAISLAISFPLPPIITAYQATGKGGVGALISSLRQGIVYILLVLTLPRLLSVLGFYILQPISDILSVTTALLVFQRSRRKLDIELSGEPEYIPDKPMLYNRPPEYQKPV